MGTNGGGGSFSFRGSACFGFGRSGGAGWLLLEKAYNIVRRAGLGRGGGGLRRSSHRSFSRRARFIPFFLPPKHYTAIRVPSLKMSHVNEYCRKSFVRNWRGGGGLLHGAGLVRVGPPGRRVSACTTVR